MRWILAGLVPIALLCCVSRALAQSWGNEVPGYLSTSNCPGGNTPCFIAYGASVPITGTSTIDQTIPGSTNGVNINPTSAATAGIVGVASAAAESSHVIKASNGNLWSAYAQNLTTTAGFLVVLNATSAPVDGAITPIDCVALPASGAATISYGAGPPGIYSTGITAVVTSATTCFTKTTGVITAFIKGNAS